MVIGLFALSGCATVDPEAAANEMCDTQSERASSYNESNDPDFEVGAEGDSVRKVSLVRVKTEAVGETVENGDGAYRVFGTAKLATALGSRYEVAWECFSQTTDGKTYASIVKWTRS